MTVNHTLLTQLHAMAICTEEWPATRQKITNPFCPIHFFVLRGIEHRPPDTLFLKGQEGYQVSEYQMQRF